jgi:uncharacterized integral membrane protein
MNNQELYNNIITKKKAFIVFLILFIILITIDSVLYYKNDKTTILTYIFGKYDGAVHASFILDVIGILICWFGYKYFSNEEDKYNIYR